MRIFIFCLVAGVSSSGCIYGEMEEDDTGSVNSSSNGACQQLTQAVCNSCSEDMCDYYRDVARDMSDADCAATYSYLQETGC